MCPNSNPPNNIDTAGEIYKMELDGTVIGKFGRAGKMLKEFGTVNAIDCRNENNLWSAKSVTSGYRGLHSGSRGSSQAIRGAPVRAPLFLK